MKIDIFSDRGVVTISEGEGFDILFFSPTFYCSFKYIFIGFGNLGEEKLI